MCDLLTQGRDTVAVWKHPWMTEVEEGHCGDWFTEIWMFIPDKANSESFFLLLLLTLETAVRKNKIKSFQGAYLDGLLRSALVHLGRVRVQLNSGLSGLKCGAQRKGVVFGLWIGHGPSVPSALPFHNHRPLTNSAYEKNKLRRGGALLRIPLCVETISQLYSSN